MGQRHPESPTSDIRHSSYFLDRCSKYGGYMPIVRGKARVAKEARMVQEQFPTHTARDVTLQEWEQLLDEFPQHTVFHTLPWLLAIESAHGASVRLVRADDEEGRCSALWPVLATRKGPLRILGSPVPGWSTAYMGPLFRANADKRSAINAFLRHPYFSDGSYFSCKVLVDQAANELARFGFVEVERLDTYCLDLTADEQALWDNLKSECRTQIRKARKMGLEVRQETDASFIDDFWRMSLETFAICKVTPGFTREFVDALWRWMHLGDRLHVLSAFHEGRRIATLVLPYDNRTMYYWAGASYLKYRGIPAHNLLLWEAIRFAKRLDLRQYDFVSTSGGGGRFKKTFGPQATHIATQWERSSSRLVAAMKSLYRQYLMRKRRLSTES